MVRWQRLLRPKNYSIIINICHWHEGFPSMGATILFLVGIRKDFKNPTYKNKIKYEGKHLCVLFGEYSHEIWKIQGPLGKPKLYLVIINIEREIIVPPMKLVYDIHGYPYFSACYIYHIICWSHKWDYFTLYQLDIMFRIGHFLGSTQAQLRQ